MALQARSIKKLNVMNSKHFALQNRLPRNEDRCNHIFFVSKELNAEYIDNTKTQQ